MRDGAEILMDHYLWRTADELYMPQDSAEVDQAMIEVITELHLLRKFKKDSEAKK